MKTLRRALLLLLLAGFLTALALTATHSAARIQTQPTAPQSLEDAYRANNIGVALLEQFKYKEAADSFRKAVTLAPKLGILHLNLGIALFNIPETEEARNEIKKALELIPDSPRPHYLLGLIAKKQNNTEEAIAELQQVVKTDAKDVGTNVNLAQLYLQQKKYTEAQGLLRTALAQEPYNTTATYNLALALLRSGQREAGQAMMQQFQRLRDSNYSTSIGQNYLEQGTYAEAVISTGAEADLVDTKTPNVTFVDATSLTLPEAAKSERNSSSLSSQLNRPSPMQVLPLGLELSAKDWDEKVKTALLASLAGDVCLLDFDGDGDLDLVEVTADRQRLLRNDGGKFVDVSNGSGLSKVPANSICLRAVAGDFDNDGKTDLFVLRYGASSLYKNEGNGKFKDVTTEAGIADYPYLALSVAFVDIDHDGDLDIFIPGFADLNLSSATQAKTSLTFPDDFARAPN